MTELLLVPTGWPSTLTKSHPPGLYLLRLHDQDADLIVVTSYGGEAFLASGSAVGAQCYEPPYLSLIHI